MRWQAVATGAKFVALAACIVALTTVGAWKSAPVPEPDASTPWSIAFPPQCIEFTNDGTVHTYMMTPIYHAAPGQTLVEAKLVAALAFLQQGDVEWPQAGITFCAVPLVPVQRGTAVVK